MAHYQVYISSTYRDLADYRKVVMESLHKVPNFTVVGMENYTAESQAPLAKCLADVDRCDIYLLILAKRYGYVPPGDELSITHQEYRRAVAPENRKVVLVFKADNRDGRFLPETDEAGQPTGAEKAARLAAFVAEVSRDFLSHPEGFTSEYHLALQVRESLVWNPRVDFDGDLPEERKIFCDRKAAVYDFYDLAKKRQPFNVFLLQGDRQSLATSLVERLSTYYLGVSAKSLVQVSYDDFLADGSYPNFRRRVINELCDNLLENEAMQPNDFDGLLAAVKARGTLTLTLWSSSVDALQWPGGYQFLNELMLELARASAAVGGIRVFWFLIIDTPDALQRALTMEVVATPPLRPVATNDLEQWLRTYVVSDDSLVLSVQELCFPDTLNPGLLTMWQAQEKIRAFIRRFNVRRKANDQALLNLLP